MTELRKLYIDGPTGKIECQLRIHPNPTATVIIAHPHPVHGGTMNNTVVFHSDRELHRAGLTTMRFNFRSAGASEGTHDNGVGEVEDTAAASSWLRGLAPHVPNLMVGYSFGAWCGLRYAQTSSFLQGFVAIGLPTRRFQFEETLQNFSIPLAVIQASEDEFGTPDEIQPILDKVPGPTQLHVVPNTSHLFPKRAKEPAALVVKATQTILANLPPYDTEKS